MSLKFPSGGHQWKKFHCPHGPMGPTFTISRTISEYMGDFYEHYGVTETPRYTCKVCGTHVPKNGPNCYKESCADVCAVLIHES